MRDQIGREINYLRLSLTERCNLHCMYCCADEASTEGQQELTGEEIGQLLAAFVRLGITKVRLTGGEPLLREDLEDIVKRISQFPSITERCLTTNGQGLPERFTALRRAGLQRINISLDSLREERYRMMTDGGSLHRVLSGIETVLREGMPLKINVVLVRGINEDERENFIALARENPIEVRFIELMPFGRIGQEHGVLGNELLADHPEWELLPSQLASPVAERYSAPGWKGCVGLIRPISHKFCRMCNRVRVTGSGRLRMCLGCEREMDLRPYLSGSPDLLYRAIRSEMYAKPIQHTMECGEPMRGRGMWQIGG